MAILYPLAFSGLVWQNIQEPLTSNEGLEMSILNPLAFSGLVWQNIVIRIAVTSAIENPRRRL